MDGGISMTIDGTYDNEERVDVVTRIPGRTENVIDPDDTNVEYDNSAIPWDFDEWFHGDFTEGWKSNRTDATSEKYLAEYDDYLPNYRIDTAVEIGFNTNGDSISGTPEVNMTEPGNSNTPGDLAPITLEGELSEPKNPFRNRFDHYDDGQGQKLGATVKGPYTRVNKNFSVGGVEGVRASIILGGSDAYLQMLKADAAVTLADLTNKEIPIYITHFMTHVATFYSFIDFAYMADGTKVVTVWDASVYPAHALYLGGEFRDENQFEKGVEWVETGWPWQHGSFFQFGLDAQNPYATPFDQGGALAYNDDSNSSDNFRKGWGDHPVMASSQEGTTLSGQEGVFADPMYPEFSNP